MASGCLSMPKEQDIAGAERFAGEIYFTSRWPHEGVDFTGKQVGVIGTGSSGIQAIPLIAEQAAQLTVFQRTPNFSIPAHNGPAEADRLERLGEDREAYREEARWSPAGVPLEVSIETVAQLSEEERRKRFEEAWDEGHLLGFGRRFADVLVNRAANEVVSEMIRERIREIVDDPETAEMLCPRDFPLATKRMCLDSGYYATFNRANVRLVDLRQQPITTVTETGIDTADESFELDAIVYATGFDAMTGALVAVDITGRDGVTLEAEVGARSGHLPGPHHGRVPQPLHDHWARQPLGAVEHGGVDRAARRLGGRPDRMDGRARRRDASSRPRPQRPAGCNTSTTAPTSRSSPLPTPGTWAPTFPASRACSCRTSEVSTGTEPSATRWSSATCSASA